jgi:putative SOS response-associated peptidase YedK
MSDDAAPSQRRPARRRHRGRDLPDDLKAMLRPYDPALMEAYAVNRVGNSVKNDTEQCIEPVVD